MTLRRYIKEDDPADLIWPRCVICGEFTDETDIAEMYDPEADEDTIHIPPASGIVHPECGIGKGWVIS